MEERPCRGKTLEGHDKSSPNLRGPVALSQSLKGFSSKSAQSVSSVLLPEVSNSLSAPALSTHLSPWTQRWTADHVSSLCSQAALIFPAPQSSWIRPSISPGCWVLISIWLLHIYLSELKNVLMSSLPCAPFLFFFYQDIPQSFFHHFSHSWRLTSAQNFLLPMNTNYQPKIDQTDSQNIVRGSKMDSVQARVCLSLTCGTPCSTYTSDVAIRSLPLCSLHLHWSTTPTKCLKNQETNTGNGRVMHWIPNSLEVDSFA